MKKSKSAIQKTDNKKITLLSRIHGATSVLLVICIVLLLVVINRVAEFVELAISDYLGVGSLIFGLLAIALSASSRTTDLNNMIKSNNENELVSKSIEELKKTCEDIHTLEKVLTEKINTINQKIDEVNSNSKTTYVASRNHYSLISHPIVCQKSESKPPKA